jgi:hypothetical protein
LAALTTDRKGWDERPLCSPTVLEILLARWPPTCREERIKKVTVSADAPVLRTAAEFLFQAADEIDNYGEAFGHVHLRDYWHEWYSAYPDMIVVRWVAPIKNQEQMPPTSQQCL